MQPSRCQELVEAYIEWLRSRISVAEIRGVCEITTPFLDRHNDYLQIYVKRSNGNLVLTDDGYTIRDLALSGCDVSSPWRKQLLTTILNGFGVRLNDDELRVEARTDTFPQKKHALLQAMLAVNDMFMTATEHVVSLFFEDVEQFLVDHGVRYTPRVQFSGKSGFVHNFDFVIPASQVKPERILRAINRPERTNVTALLFAWNDTKEIRSPNSMAYAMLNDSEKPLSSDVIVALRQYGIIGVTWSGREEFASELAA
ncbi:MAG: DUF1828 domain-containing protein [Planctomycetes bacterium]|nr:DUF1828 domain-containing protein [Planctomycetota bacterium]